MMKRLKHSNIYIWSLLLATLVSCSDLLEPEPKNIAYPKVFWINTGNVEQALAGDYALFKEAIMTKASFLFWGEFPGKNFLDSRFWIANLVEDSGNYILPYREETRDWRRFYRAANWGLTIESKVADMDLSLFSSQAQKDQFIGEAAFIRGLSYFYIAKIWGDAPILDVPLESVEQLIDEDGYIVQRARSTEQEVLDYALEATNKAIALLDYAAPGETNWAIRANKASAEALKAHLTAWYAGRDNNNSEMLQQTIAATTSVIDNSGASLINYAGDGESEGETGFTEMCRGQSQTGLFEINIDASSDESFRVGFDSSHYTGLTLNFPVRSEVNENVTPKLVNDFYGTKMMTNDPDRENDVRKDLFFYEYGQINGFLNKYSERTQDSNDPNNQYAFFSEANILIFRLADMYLLRAEAHAKLGDATAAVADLNMIRTQAGVPDYTGATDTQSLIKAIFDERAIEFVGEGQIAFDRIRMNYFEGVSWAVKSRNYKKGYFWPVSLETIRRNPSITQAEYWQGKAG